MIDETIIVSVVVPIYNVEKYLDRCINSIVNQTYKNIQILLVDDGSIDKSLEICQKWERKDKRIEVIHKENSGLGMTRNVGLKKASGKYVCFVDSDDYINLSTIEKLVTKISEHQADVCYYGCIDVIDGNETIKSAPSRTLFKGAAVQQEFAVKLLGNLPEEKEPLFSGMSACYAFYDNQFLKEHSIEFYSERDSYISEDLIFNLDVCSSAKVVTILPESLYYYVIRKKDSLRSTYRLDRFEKNKHMYNKLLEYSQAFKAGTEGIVRTQSYFLQMSIVCVKMEVLIKSNMHDCVKSIKNYAEDDVLTKILQKYPITKLSWKQKAFCYALKFHWYRLVYFMAWLQNQKLKEYV